MAHGSFAETPEQQEARRRQLYLDAAAGLRVTPGQVKTLRQARRRERRWLDEPVTKAHAAGFITGWVVMGIILTLAGVR